MKPDMFDVIEVEIKAPHRVALGQIAFHYANAEAYIQMAVIRRGCKHHFYTKSQPGKYSDGDKH